MVPCPECSNAIPEHGGGWCPYCQAETRRSIEGSSAWRPFAAGGRSWGSSTFLVAGIIAGVISGLCASAYASDGDSTWLSLSSGLGVLALIWLLIGAVARGVAVGMREHGEG